MSELPPFLEAGAYAGDDTAEQWSNYVEGLYAVYVRSVARGNLRFRGEAVNCQFRPETFGKHFAFWHMMQEGFPEENRTMDPERCRRVVWIAWVIGNAGVDSRIRVFPQSRGSVQSWVLWLHEHDYAVILHQRNGYYLLKTAFMVKSHKRTEFERDWNAHNAPKMAGAAPDGTAPKAPSTHGG